MSTVIETLAEYHTFLKYERHIKESTIRKVYLSLKYFTELYGITETKELKASDMYIFYEWLKWKKCRRTKAGEQKEFGDAFLQKIMTHVKSYIKRLSETAQLNKLVPADVPRGKVKPKPPTFLTNEEMKLLFHGLEKEVATSIVIWNKHRLYSAYLWRAVVRMLYTTGLRNFELRKLTYEDINFSEMCGTVLWKGDKYGVYTFSVKAKEYLEEYLHIRDTFFPDTKFRYLFTLYEKGVATYLTEQKLNREIKKIATKTGIKQNVHAHLFRHTLATHLIRTWRSIVDVRDKMRHTNIATTSVYVHGNTQSIKSKTMALWNDLLAF